MHISDTFVRNV